MDALALLRLQIEWGADEALLDEPVDRLAAPGATLIAPASRVAPRPDTATPPDTAPPDSGPSDSGPSDSGPSDIANPGSGPSDTVPSDTVPPGQAPSRGRPTERTASAGPPPRGASFGADTPASPTAARAAALAADAQDLPALRAVIAGFQGFGLRDTASNLVFAEGAPDARLLLVGEPPGADEDRAGRPFAGETGDLLDRMLASIGLERSSVLLAPLIPWRPPGGRPPHATELAVCLPFLLRLIELAAPSHVVSFGTLAARTLAPGRKRGEAWGSLEGSGGSVPVLALPGLGAIRREPSRKRDAWAGLRRLRRALDEPGRG